MESNFPKKVITLSIGTIGSQIVIISSTPILTRIYAPEDFGGFTIFFSIVSVLSLFATGRYELGIVLAKSNKDAIGIASLSFFLSILFSISCFLFLLIFSNYINEHGNFKKIYEYWYLIPNAVAIVSFYQIATYYHLRLEDYKKISINRMVQSITSSLFQITLGIFSFGIFGLIFGYIFGYILGLFLFVKNELFVSYLLKLACYKRLMVLSRKYSRFPKYELPQSFIDSFHNYGVYFIIGYFYPVSKVGLFALSMRIALLPSSVIGGAMANVFYSSVSKDKGNLYLLTIRLIKKMVVFSACLYMLLFITAEFVVSFVFGEEWRNSGLIIKYLCFWLFLRFISSPISTIPLLINKQSTFLLFGITYNILVFGSLLSTALLDYTFLDSILITYTISGFFLVLVINWLILQAREFNEV